MKRLVLLLLAICGLTMATSNDDQNNDPTDLILFMFFGLFLGIIVMQVLSRVNDALPYTVVIFLLGIVLSSFNYVSGDGMWGNSIAKWSEIDATLLLFVFLPPLIFGEAMFLNWFFVIGGFIQSLLLAGPGVVFGSFVMGALAKVIVPYSWSWNLALVFGSILSATDPVAVVALLKEAGASPKLTILIVGESLMNDGTAMVMFTIFHNLLIGQNYDAGEVISFIFKACLGSPLFGIACGAVMVTWLKSAQRPLKEVDVTIQVAITICCAYMIFFVAQNPLQISGVLACCGAGVLVAWLGQPLILNHETMHNVWGMIEWMGNTLIFLLAGLIIGTRTWKQVDWIDLVYLVVLYVVLMVLRLVIIALLYPWLSTLGHKCTRKEAVFMAWSGLRGALAMALALIVEKSGREIPGVDQKETSRMFFYIGGIAAITLILNANTAGWLLDALGLVGAENFEQAIIMAQIRKLLRKKIDKMVDDHKLDLRAEELDSIRASFSLLRRQSLDTSGVEMNVLLAGKEKIQISPLQLPTPEQQSTGTNSSEAEEKAVAANDVEAANNSRKEPRPQRRMSATVLRARSPSQEGRDNLWENCAQSVGDVVQMARERDQHQNSNNDSTPVTELLYYIRTIFLEIVRVKYWRDIEAGKLPRQSFSAQFLLFSIDVGLDSVRNTSAVLQDWTCVESHLDRIPLYLRVMAFIDKFTPGTITSRLLGRLEALREKRCVYMLTAFIDAHEHAQRKLHSIVGAESEGESVPQTLEESKVKLESTAAVDKAKLRLSQMDASTVAAMRAKQAARMLLAKQAEMVSEMMHDGLLKQKHAEKFLGEIANDAAAIERERNHIYKAQAEQRALQRQMDKLESSSSRSSEDRSSFAARNNTVSFFNGRNSPSKSKEPVDSRTEKSIGSAASI